MFEAKGQSFSWALEKMKEGIRVKRKSDPSTKAYFAKEVTGRGICIFSEYRPIKYEPSFPVEEGHLQSNDICANDWTYYEAVNREIK